MRTAVRPLGDQERVAAVAAQQQLVVQVAVAPVGGLPRLRGYGRWPDGGARSCWKRPPVTSSTRPGPPASPRIGRRMSPSQVAVEGTGRRHPGPPVHPRLEQRQGAVQAVDAPGGVGRGPPSFSSREPAALSGVGGTDDGAVRLTGHLPFDVDLVQGEWRTQPSGLPVGPGVVDRRRIVVAGEPGRAGGLHRAERERTRRPCWRARRCRR